MWRGPVAAADFAARFEGGERARLARAGYAIGPDDRDLMGVAFRYDSLAKGLRISTVAVEGVTLSLRAADAATGVPVTESTLLRGDGKWYLEGRYRGQLMRESRILTLASHRAVGKPVRIATPPDAKYPGTGQFTLTDGVHGTAFADGFWNGWLGVDVDATIDLGTATPVDSVVVSLLEEVRSWILLPREVRLSVSADGVRWEDGGVRPVQRDIDPDGRTRPRVTLTLPAGTKARYVRVVAINGGRLPRWHPGAGEASWVFLDEIEVH